MLTQSEKRIYKRIAGLVAVLLALSMMAPAWSIEIERSGLGLSQTADTTTTTDVIVGHNNKGPYPLSWTNMDSGSINAVLNDRKLRWGQDYNVDLAKGVVTFNSVLANDAIVRVSYRIIPGKSKHSNNQSSIPVTLNLLQADDASLKVMGLFSQDGANNPDKGKTVIGIGGDRKWSTSNISTMFLVSQGSNTNSADGGSSWDRSAMKFGGDTSLGALKFSGSYLRAGKDFAGAKEYGTGAGKQVTDLGAEFAPSKILRASARFQDSEDTGGNTKGNRSTVNEQKFIYTPGTTTQLSLLHNTTTTATAAANSERSVDTSSMRLDQKIGAKTTALMTFENTNIATGQNSDQIQSTGFQIASGAIDRMSLRAAVAQKSSKLLGNDRSMAFGATANPLKQLNLDINYAAISNQAVGNQATTDVKIAANPMPQLAVQAAYSGVDSSKQGSATRANVAFQASPLQKLQIQGNLVGTSQKDNEQFQRDFTLTSKPVDFARFSAMYSEKGALSDTASSDDVTKGASLELTPLANMKFGAGYKYIDTGTRILEIKDYLASSQLWNLLSIGGTYRDRTLREDEVPDSMAVQLSLAPVRYFTLTGDYKGNPEDDKGQIQEFNSATVGLTTHVGSINLLTNYTEKDEYKASRFSDERKVGLELPVFGHGRLSTGYKVTRLLTGSQLLSNTYSLGYQHSIGSDFVLSLNGYYTQWAQDNMMLQDKTEYNAEANLGIKF